MDLTSEQLDRLSKLLQGTCDGIESALGKIGVEDDEIDVCEVEDALAGIGTEMCQGCGWWFETGELVGDPEEFGEDAEPGLCDDCRRGQ